MGMMSWFTKQMEPKPETGFARYQRWGKQVSLFEAAVREFRTAEAGGWKKFNAAKFERLAKEAAEVTNGAR